MEEELLEYICAAPCLALVGSGPSSECGLPTWKTLAEQILNRVSSLSLPNKEIDPIEMAFGQENYPLMFDRIARSKATGLGEYFLYDSCKEILSSPCANGRVYEVVVRLPFRAYFTTNFDDLLATYLERAQVAPIPLKNTPDDLAKVDVDALSGYVIKLHGDFESNSHLVLTESQYDAVCFDSKFEYLRKFIQTYLQSRRFVIVGYSVRDPDIQSVLKQNTFLFKRSTPIYAFLANASDTDIDEWDHRYNIRVIPYRVIKGDHSQLASILSSLTDYMGQNPNPKGQLNIPLRVAQSLYMWYRFRVGPEQGMRLDAFKALLLSLATQKMSSEGYVNRSNLATELRNITGMSEKEQRVSLQEFLQSACEEGFLTEKPPGESFKVETKTKQLVEQSKQQYSILVDTFRKQVRIDFRAQNAQLKDTVLSQIADAVVDTLNAIFSERGIEVVNMVFAHQQPRLAGAAALFRIILGGARRLEAPSIQYAIVRYITKLFSTPSANQERYLEYLSKAFVCIQVLGMDPDGNRLRKEFLSNRTLIVDDNVLIPLLAVGGSKCAFFDSLLKLAHESGMRLATTPHSVEEVYDHLTWARHIVDDNRANPNEILRAALGHGRYKRNAFLDGWVQYAALHNNLSFSGYMEAILGKGVARGSIEGKLRNVYHMTLLNFDRLGNANQEAYVVREETEAFIEQAAAENDILKSRQRIKAEAEVYAYLYYWQELCPEGAGKKDWKASFLSQGGFLNRIAFNGPYPQGKGVVVSPDALYELLASFGGNPVKFASFADVLHSTYLYSADYFIDRSKYANFFGSLINQAERIYADGLEDYRHHIDKSLTSDFINEIEPLERPLMVDQLQSRLSERLAEVKKEKEDLLIETERLRQQLEAEKAKNESWSRRAQRMKDYGTRVAKRNQRRRGKKR